MGGIGSKTNRLHNAIESDPLLKSQDSDDTLAQFVSDVGPEFIAAIVVLKHLSWAFTLNLIGQTGYYIFRDYAVPATSIQLYTMVTCFPLALQPVICSWSDKYPIFGYRKAPYLALAILLGAPAALVLGVVPKEQLPITCVIACMTLIKGQWSTTNVLGESALCIRIRQLPQCGTQLVFFAKMGILAMSLVGSICSGLALERFGPKPVNLIAFPFLLIAIIPVGLNWLGERTGAGSGDEDGTTIHPGLESTCWLACSGATALVVVSSLGQTPLICSITAVLVVAILLLSYAIYLPRQIGKFFVWALLTGALNVSYKGAAYYFYTDSSLEYPSGPHFSPFFYATVMNSVSVVFGMLGMVTYLNCLYAWRYREILLVTVIAAACGRFMDAILFLRVNHRIGAPDSLLVLGEEVLLPVIDAFRAMPIALLIAHISPKGMESTVVGLNASTWYIGNAASQCFGALLLKFLKCEPDGGEDESAAFRHFWLAPICSGVLILIVGFSFLPLIPDAQQGSAPRDVDTEDDDDP